MLEEVDDGVGGGWVIESVVFEFVVWEFEVDVGVEMADDVVGGGVVVVVDVWG